MPFNLSLTNPSFNASGKFGQSLNGGYGFSGNPIPTSGPFTIEVWLKSTDATDYRVACGSNQGAWIGQKNNGQVWAFYGMQDATIDTTVSVNDGAWHHVSLNVDPSGSTPSRLFVDGVLAGSVTAARSISAAGQFGIRAFNNGSVGFLWVGDVDEVSVSSGIKRTANFSVPTAATPNNDANILALWHLDGIGNDSANQGAAVAPGAPTLGTAVAGDATASFPYTAPSSDGGSPVTGYSLTVYYASNNEVVGTVATTLDNPIVADGLINGSAVYGRLRAINSVGQSTQSAPSNTVTPQAGAGRVAIPYNDPAIYYSPYNWDDRGTYKVTNNPGAYAKIAFTGTSISVNVDVSAISAAGVAASNYPIVRTVVDGVSFVDTQLTNTSISVMRSGLTSGSHTLEFFFFAANIGDFDRWNTPVNAVRVTGFTIDNGGTYSAPALSPKRMLYFGDSITEGYLALGTSNASPAGNSCLHTVPPSLAKAMNCEYGVVAFSGQGYQQVGNGNVPAWPSAYSLYSAGRSRLVNAKFDPAPDFIMVEHGANGTTTTANVQSMMTNLRAAAPSAKIIMIVPAGGYARSAISSGFAAANDPNAILVSLSSSFEVGINQFGTGPNMWSLDGLHRNSLSNARVATAYMQSIQSSLDSTQTAQPATNARTVTITLKDANGVVANLSNAKVAVYDEATPDLRSAPRYKSATGSTNAAGVMSITYQSTLPVGAQCGVSLQMTDGRNFDVVGTVA